MNLADLQLSIEDRIVTARVAGEIDISNGPQLAAGILRATPNEAHGVILELSEVNYLDSAGIHLLYRLRESLRTRGQVLKVVIPPDSVVRSSLRLAGVEGHIDVAAAIEDALRDLHGPAPAGSEA
jgi:anti-sigma B factor antagonist